MAWHSGKAIDSLLGKSNREKSQAAAAMGTTTTTLYRWLKKDTLPDRVLAAAAEYFGVNPKWLASGVEPKYIADFDPLTAHVKALELRFMVAHKRLIEKYTRDVLKAIRDHAEALSTANVRQWNPRGDDQDY